MSSRATVSLPAIRHNLAVASSLAPGCAVLFAVKADAYGHGAVEVSRMVERTGAASWLGVAEVAEGLQLRTAGVRLPILKLSGCLPDEWDAAVAADLVLTVADVRGARAAEAAAAAKGTTVRVHLKVDTGMGRIGVPPQQAVDLAHLLDGSPHLALEGLFTHLASADVADDGGFTRRQLRSFRTVSTAVQQARGAVPWVHAANSAGVLFTDHAGMTMVRPGIMGYGYHPDRDHPAEVELRPALRWTTALSFSKQVSAGTPIGYGSTWTAPRDTWIGTIPIGYADGFSRAQGNRGRVLVGGEVVPVVGRVCMDQTMLDLGQHGGRLSVGDEVVVIGRQGGHQISADDLAAVGSTISYDVLCAIGGRVPRVHEEFPSE